MRSGKRDGGNANLVWEQARLRFHSSRQCQRRAERGQGEVPSNRSVRRPGQMGDAIFFAVARHAKFETGIAQFGGAACRTFVQRLFFTARLDFETLAPDSDFFSLPQMLDHTGAEENE